MNNTQRNNLKIHVVIKKSYEKFALCIQLKCKQRLNDLMFREEISNNFFQNLHKELRNKPFLFTPILN